MNQKGQAAIESLFIGCILVVAIGLFLRLAVKVQRDFLVDEWIEQTLICLVQKKANCEFQLRKKLAAHQYSAISTRVVRSGSKQSLSVKALSPFNEPFEKESEIEYDLSISY